MFTPKKLRAFFMFFMALIFTYPLLCYNYNISSNPQSRVIFSYDSINKSKLNYISLARENTIDKEFLNTCNGDSLWKTKFTLSAQYGISSQTYSHHPTSCKFDHRDIVIAAKDTFTIDSIFPRYDNVKKEIDYKRIVPVSEFEFYFKKDTFLAFFFADITLNTHTESYLFFMFKINNSHPKILYHGYQATDHLNCIGDIGEDGNLNYLSLGECCGVKDTLCLYNFNKTKLEKTDKFLVIEAYGINSYVNYSKSNWVAGK